MAAGDGAGAERGADHGRTAGAGGNGDGRTAALGAQVGCSAARQEVAAAAGDSSGQGEREEDGCTGRRKGPGSRTVGGGGEAARMARGGGDAAGCTAAGEEEEQQQQGVLLGDIGQEQHVGVESGCTAAAAAALAGVRGTVEEEEVRTGASGAPLSGRDSPAQALALPRGSDAAFDVPHAVHLGCRPAAPT